MESTQSDDKGTHYSGYPSLFVNLFSNYFPCKQFHAAYFEVNRLLKKKRDCLVFKYQTVPVLQKRSGLIYYKRECIIQTMRIPLVFNNNRNPVSPFRRFTSKRQLHTPASIHHKFLFKKIGITICRVHIHD